MKITWNDKEMEAASAQERIAWAKANLPDAPFACSFQDIVLLDMLRRVWSSIEVIFLDTHAHFPETYAFVEEAAAACHIRLTTLHPGPEADRAPCGTPDCCRLRKVEPLKRALAGRTGWLSGLKRVDGPSRANAKVLEFDEVFGVVKMNPLVDWGDADIDHYIVTHSLPRHPLTTEGYLSIGCAPTTAPVVEGGDPRSGRWGGDDKTECGLHEAPSAAPKSAQ